MQNFFLDLFFPKTCFGCKKEGTYLCDDCEAVLEVFYTHETFKNPVLCDLYFAVSYDKKLIKDLIGKFKYQPFSKDLAKTIARLITHHFMLIDKNINDFQGFLIIPVPVHIKKMKWRGFNHSEEIAKHLADYFKIDLAADVLVKTRQTQPQMRLPKKERQSNVLCAFECRNREQLQNKNVLLIDDVYSTGTTMTECARVLKNSGAGKIIGIVAAITQP